MEIIREMKAIILAAGSNFGNIPKCLYHVAGEHLLGGKVQMLRQLGVNDIRIVVGWQRDEIAKFNKEKNLGLELVYNPDWSSDAIKSLTTGLQGVDDDVLILFADDLIRLDVIEGLIRCKALLCCISGNPYKSAIEGHTFAWGGHYQQIWICKFSRERLHVLKDIQKYAERCAEKWVVNQSTPLNRASGYIIMLAMAGIFEEFKHEAGSVVAVNVPDIDMYEQTDEGRGMNFEKKG